MQNLSSHAYGELLPYVLGMIGSNHYLCGGDASLILPRDAPKKVDEVVTKSSMTRGISVSCSSLNRGMPRLSPAVSSR